MPRFIGLMVMTHLLLRLFLSGCRSLGTGSGSQWWLRHFWKMSLLRDPEPAFLRLPRESCRYPSLFPQFAHGQQHHSSGCSPLPYSSLCRPHSCHHCCTEVDHYATHGLSYRWSEGHHYRHAAINDIVHHALSLVKVPSHLEPAGIYIPFGRDETGWYNIGLMGERKAVFGMPPTRTPSLLPTFPMQSVGWELWQPRLRRRKCRSTSALIPPTLLPQCQWRPLMFSVL